TTADELQHKMRQKVSSAKHKAFIILSAIFILTAYQHINYVPLWDGRMYWVAYQRPVIELCQDCKVHPSHFHRLIYCSSQLLDPGNPKISSAINLILGLGGLAIFYKLLKHIHGEKISETEAALITFLFGFNPVFMAHIIQPSLDYNLPIYITAATYFLLKEKYFTASLFGLFATFTKEPGSVAYTLIVLSYILFVKKIHWKDTKKNIKNLFTLTYPTALFIIYLRFFSLYQIRNKDLLTSVLSPALNDLFDPQLAVMYLLNFNWIMTAVILAGAAIQLHASLKKREIRLKPNLVLFLTSSLIPLAYLLSKIRNNNNPRYMLITAPFFILLFSLFLMKTIKRKPHRTALLIILLTLIYASAYRTIDPISKSFYGVFEFGDQQILQMIKYVQRNYFGRDQLVYNFEYMNLEYLTEDIVTDLGIENTYVSTHGPGVYSGPSLCLLDVENTMRMVKPDGSTYNCKTELGDEFYYIIYPIIRKHMIKEFNEEYDSVRNITYENSGYRISVIHYRKKETID
ncbi:MAG: hypothetical protein KKD39_06675, partial [Candidatus Altiarchaeota archaeon]|nr:hypothetical protein [Candidatus Altiarchaeota archaeon]